jgi:Undecaprenyl-phosphate glucose phosphotransferase
MLKKHAQLFEGLFTATDIFVVSAAWTLSYWVRFSSGLIPVEKGIPPFSDYLKMLLFVWLIWAFVFRRFGLYQAMRGVSRFREVFKVIRANTFSVLLLVAATFLFREKSIPYSRLVFLIFWLLSTVFTVSSRSVIRGFLRMLRRRGYNLRYVLIVGAGELAERIAARIRSNPEFGIEVYGCLKRGEGNGDGAGALRLATQSVPVASFCQAQALRANAQPQTALASVERAENITPALLPVVGTYEDLPRLIAQAWIDQVIVALPLRDHDLLESVISSIGDSIVDVKIVPDVHHFIQLGSQVEDFDGLPVVTLASTPLAGFNRFGKRIFDLVVGSLLFVFFLPLMLLIALLIKLTSRGPVFFVQERVSFVGRPFNIIKFRTMHVDAEENGAQFAVRNDPRTTPIGAFLRKYSLDELPQLLNVILGQMSLVGPRPERPVFIDDFRKRIPRYMLRHKVQAGMTGWAQVHGWRGNTSIEKRIEHDLYYIENWSLLFDIKILFLTLRNGFRHRNAY